MFSRRVLAALLVCLFIAPALSAQQTWKVCMVIKRKVNATYKGVTVNASMDDADVAAIKTAFTNYAPALVSRLSNGQVKWQTVVIDDPTNPITHVEKITDISCAPRADCIANESLLGNNTYDSIFVYWLNKDPKKPYGPALQVDQNFGSGPYTGTHGAGFSTVCYFPPSTLTVNSDQVDTFVHEWLHQVEAYYNGAIYLPKPKSGDSSYLHSAEGHGYSKINNTSDLGYWKTWYRDFLQGQVVEPNGFRSGVGPSGWALGTIREKRVVDVPLVNADQEYGLADWPAVSWANQPNFRYYETTYQVTGKTSTVLIANKPDDIKASVVVSIKPYTKYIFSSWVKTENVVIRQSGGQFGANISLWGQPEASRSITGTNDWTWVQLPFNSGSRSSVELCLRLGHHGSTSTGKAWFDNVHLVEIH